MKMTDKKKAGVEMKNMTAGNKLRF